MVTVFICVKIAGNQRKVPKKIGKVVVFCITSRMKAMREQVDEELLVIKLFASNYTRDLILNY